MSELPEEERRYYTLKAKDFERVNAPKEQGDVDPNDVRAALNQNLSRLDARSRSPLHKRPEEQANETDPNDVYSVLNENLIKHKASAKPLDLTKKSSQRLRDYIGALILGNFLFLGIGILLPINAVTLLFILGGMTMYFAGLSWVFWGVMSDY